MLAMFDRSQVLREETKRANAKRARICVNFCAELTDDQIEAWLKKGSTARVILAEAEDRRVIEHEQEK